MNVFWKNALNIAPVVAIVGFVLWKTIERVFEKEILEIFGEGQLFIIVLVIIFGLLICLFAAVLTFKQKKTAPQVSQGNKATFKYSTIQGDVVLGDKNVNTNKDD
jgi:predicted membrane protein